MFVDPVMLAVGSTHSRSAAEHAQAGAASLDHNTVATGTFGSFSAADVYHQAVSTMDQHNAAELRAVRCNSAT